MSDIVSPQKKEQLKLKMEELNIRECDIQEKFILSSGPGGQHANKNETCVYLKHLPTGTEVKCSESRSRENNRFFARRLLVQKIEENVLKIKTDRIQKIEKLKRQKRKRSKRAKDKMLDNKKMNSEKKANRKVEF